jgi:hypothetical protein
MINADQVFEKKRKKHKGTSQAFWWIIAGSA